MLPHMINLNTLSAPREPHPALGLTDEAHYPKDN